MEDGAGAAEFLELVAKIVRSRGKITVIVE